jgi:hypothetical protein
LKCLPSAWKHPQRRQNSFHALQNEDHISLFVIIVKTFFSNWQKIFCFNVKETGLRAIVDSVIIIFKIWNQDIVAMCIMGCGKKKFRNIPLVNNPVYRAIKLICNRAIHESEIVCRFLKHRLHLGYGLLVMTRDSYPALGVSKMFVISKWHLTGAPKLTFERKLKA